MPFTSKHIDNLIIPFAHWQWNVNNKILFYYFCIFFLIFHFMSCKIVFDEKIDFYFAGKHYWHILDTNFFYLFFQTANSLSSKIFIIFRMMIPVVMSNTSIQWKIMFFFPRCCDLFFFIFQRYVLRIPWNAKNHTNDVIQVDI